MTRRVDDRIADILTSISNCEKYQQHFSDSGGDLARMAVDAVLRNIEIIGEAVNHLPADITDAHPDIPWAAIVGMRNNLIHRYFDTDTEIVREVLDRDLRPLKDALLLHTGR